MNISTTDIEGLLILEPKVFEDDRGYFFESYNKLKLASHLIDLEFVQDNEAKSMKGVLRGLHYQISPFAQAKLVRVIKGAVWDIAVDIRPDSETYGKWYAAELSEQNKKQFYIPAGFAHGYLTLVDNTIFAYKCDNYYSKDHEGGIIYNDPQLGIPWPSIVGGYKLSAKDRAQPLFGAHKLFK